MIARQPQPRMMRTAMHHGMTTLASATLVALTIPANLVWVRVGGYCLYWVGCAVAFVPIMHASDRVARALNRRLEHVATDESLHEHLRRYRSDLDLAMRESSDGREPGADSDTEST